MENINSIKDSLFYPSATEWMWNYCIFLGSYVSKDGTAYDLGIHITEDRTASAAIVYSNEPGDYYSGELDVFGLGEYITNNEEIYEETRRRANNLGYYNGPFNKYISKGFQ